jgi:hypothetical protein
MEITSASQSVATVHSLSRSPLTYCSASSRSMRAVRILSMAEGRAVACPSSSKSWSRRASARYDSQPSQVLRASARASKAPLYSRSWWSSALIWSRAPYLSQARCSSSCRQQTKPMSATPQRQTRKRRDLSYGPPWAHYLGGYQDRLLGGPLVLPGL